MTPSVLITLTSLLAIMTYLVTPWLAKTTQPLRKNRYLLYGGSLALVSQAVALGLIMFRDDGFFISAVLMIALIGWFISLITIINLLRGRPVAEMCWLIFPLAAATSLLALLWGETNHNATLLSSTIGAHVIISVLAHAMVTIAALHALSLGLLDYSLKRHHMGGLLGNILALFPPLNTMESLLFEMVWWSFALLSLVILSGMILPGKLCDTPGNHSLIFSILAWLFFVVLLWGHYQRGWRATTAARWTLGGFLSLLCAYFGTSVVLM